MKLKFLEGVAFSGAIEGSGGSPAPSPVDNGVIAQDIRDVFNFDPFKPDDDTSPAGGTSGPATVDPPAGGPPAPVSADPPSQPQVADPAAPPLAPPAAPTVPDANVALAHSAAELAAAAQALRQVQTSTPPAQPQMDEWAPRAILPGADTPTQIDYAQIMGRLPQQLLDGIRSENPAEFNHSLTNLMGVVAHVVHRNATQHAVAQLRAEFSQILPRYFDDQWEVREGQRMIMTDFYTKFPHLGRNNQLKQIVQREAQQMVGQYGNWSERFRDDLGARVYALLGVPMPGVPQAPAAAPPSPAPQMSGTGSRPMVPPAPSAKQPWDDLFT